MRGIPSDYAGRGEQCVVSGEPQLLRGGEWELERGPTPGDMRPVGAVAPSGLEAPSHHPLCTRGSSTGRCAVPSESDNKGPTDEERSHLRSAPYAPLGAVSFKEDSVRVIVLSGLCPEERSSKPVRGADGRSFAVSAGAPWQTGSGA